MGAILLRLRVGPEPGLVWEYGRRYVYGMMLAGIWLQAIDWKRKQA
jgi:hypothetical protein